MIPTIDLGLADGSADTNRIAAEIAHHCQNLGFFVIAGHGISPALLDQLRSAGQWFFDLPMSEKEAISLAGSDVHRGYARLHQEKIAPHGPADYRETFLIGWERRDGSQLPPRIPLLGPNRWPSNAPWFRELLNGYYDTVMRVGQFLLKCIALSIDQDENFFAHMFQDPLTNLVLAHYPVLEQTSDETLLGCGEHTDYGLITLLLHDGIPGLQVQTRDGAWLDATSERNELIVNIGDMLEFITGGLYVSNLHRVQIMHKVPRLSIPFFIQPDYDTLIKPVLEPVMSPQDRTRWKPRLGGAYLEERFAASFPTPTQRLITKMQSQSVSKRDAVRDAAQLLLLLSEQ